MRKPKISNLRRHWSPIRLASFDSYRQPLNIKDFEPTKPFNLGTSSISKEIYFSVWKCFRPERLHSFESFWLPIKRNDSKPTRRSNPQTSTDSQQQRIWSDCRLGPNSQIPNPWLFSNSTFCRDVQLFQSKSEGRHGSINIPRIPTSYYTINISHTKTKLSIMVSVHSQFLSVFLSTYKWKHLTF